MHKYMILDTKTQTPFYFSYPSPYAKVLNSWQKIPIAVGGIPFLKPYGNRTDTLLVISESTNMYNIHSKPTVRWQQNWPRL